MNPMIQAVAAEAKYSTRRPQASLTASTLSASDSLSRSHLRERHEARTRAANATFKTAHPSEATREMVLRGRCIVKVSTVG